MRSLNWFNFVRFNFFLFYKCVSPLTKYILNFIIDRATRNISHASKTGLFCSHFYRCNWERDLRLLFYCSLKCTFYILCLAMELVKSGASAKILLPVYTRIFSLNALRDNCRWLQNLTQVHILKRQINFYFLLCI